MSRNRLPLADLKRKLANQAARTRVLAPPPEDDASLLKAALTGVQPLPASDLAEVEQPKPAPLPRAREAAFRADPGPAAPKKPNDWVPATWLAEEADSKPLSGEGRALADALKGVVPIQQKRIELETDKPAPLPIQHLRDEQAALSDSIYAPTSLDLHLEGGDELTYLANGVPRTILRDLRRGRWVVQESVDLHGCNREEARELLAACMAQWRKRGVRCVRVVHGKGRGSPGKDPVLKKLVAGWLMNYEEVAAYCQARLAEGGAGALIVLLKTVRPGPKPTQ